MKKIAYTFFLAVSLCALGQQPLINSISPTQVEVGGTVTISGSDLGGRVFFGGVEATSVSGSGNVMEAIVPGGATHGPITVLNNTLVAQSSQNFYISYSGLSITDFDAQYSLSSGEQDAEDICLCDLDGDDLNDVVIAHDVSGDPKSEISIYENQSTGTTTQFNKLTNINNPENVFGFLAVRCVDLDNDGSPELIFTPNAGSSLKHVYIYRNQSTTGNINMSYLSSLNLRLPNFSGGNRNPRYIDAADIDGDGKVDLVVGNTSDNTIHIFRNTSSGVGNFSFAAVDEISADGETSGIVGIADLDNDGRPEILSTPFRGNNTRVHILKNNSIIGSISFTPQTSITNGGDTNDLEIGDFDADGLNDIVVASRDGGLISTFRNSTSGSSITFDAAENISISGNSPFGVALGDINGDGQVDLVSSFAVGNIYAYPNVSTTGDVAFGSEQQLSTTETTQYVCVGDLNGDAKPDIAFTHDISAGGPIGDLSVFINRNCINPNISPLGLNYCTGTVFRLFATNALDATYNWTITAGTGTSPGNTGSNNFADFNIPSGTSVTVQVEVTQSNTTCTTPTATETFTLDASVTGDPAINVSPNGTVWCEGDPITLSSSTTNSSYQWTLPDGSTSTSSTINIASLSPADAGEYTLRVQNAGSCASTEVTRTIAVSDPPTLQIFNNGNDNFCDDGANDPQLEVSNIAGLSYQWKRDGTDISGATSTTHTADQTGDYTVEVTDINMCTTETNIYSVMELTEPVAALDASSPDVTCVNVPTTFTAASTVQSGFTPVNSWVIEDATNTVVSTGTGDTHQFTFPSVGTYEVFVTTTYDPTVVSSCSNTTAPFSVTVSAVPTITFDVADDTEKCQGESLTVGVSSPTASEIDTYTWTVNGNVTTDATTVATTLIGEDFVYAVLEINTTIGCTVRDSVRILNFPTTADISSPDFDIVTNDSVTLEEASSIQLAAENVVSDFQWTPVTIVDNPTSSSVTVFPSTSTTVVTLTGTDANNCQVASAVTIILDNIRPRKTFSPNGDGTNDFWEILNTDVLVGCEIFIFDSRGRNLKVATSPFPNNQVWDGTSGGNQVPEGLYYFVLKCDDSNLSQSGSILLAR